MKLKTIIVLSILLILCVGYAVVRQSGRSGPSSAVSGGRRDEGLVFGQAQGLFNSLTIQGRTALPITLTRTEETWLITSPIKARADESIAAEIASALRELSFTRTFGEADQVADDRQLGLAKPRWRVTATDASGERFQLLVGSQSPGSDRRQATTYVRALGPGLPAAGRAGIVSMDFTPLLERAADDYRDPQVVRVSPGQVVSLSVAGEHTYTLERHEDGWRIVLSPELTAPADNEAVEDFIKRVCSVRAESFVDTDDPSRHGLTEDSARLILEITYRRQSSEGAEPPTQGITLLLGRQSESELYVRLTGAGEEAVFLADGDLLSELQPAPKDLRSHRVLKLDAASVTGISITTPAGKVELTRTSGGWRMLEPVLGPADNETVEQLLKALATMQASSFHDDVPAAVFGIDKPNAIIALDLSQPRQQMKLTVGSVTPGGEGVFVQSDCQPAVVTVSQSTAKVLLAGPGAYHSRNIGSVPAEARITRLVLSRPDGTFTVELDKEGHWQMLSPVTGRADEDTVAGIISAIRNLRAREIVSWADPLPRIYANEVRSAIVATIAVAPSEQGDTAQPTQTYVLRMIRLRNEWSGEYVGTYAWAPGAKPPIVGKIDPAVYEQLMGNLSWRRLWQFDPAGATEISLAQGGDKPFVLHRSEDHWTVADDPYARVNSQAVADYIEAASKLSVYKHLADSLDHLDRFDLQTPWLTLQLTDRDGAVHRIAVASHGPEGDTRTWYATASGVRTVFLLDGKAIGALAKKQSEFLAD